MSPKWGMHDARLRGFVPFGSWCVGLGDGCGCRYPAGSHQLPAPHQLDLCLLLLYAGCMKLTPSLRILIMLAAAAGIGACASTETPDPAREMAAQGTVAPAAVDPATGMPVPHQQTAAAEAAKPPSSTVSRGSGESVFSKVGFCEGSSMGMGTSSRCAPKRKVSARRLSAERPSTGASAVDKRRQEQNDLDIQP